MVSKGVSDDESMIVALFFGTLVGLFPIGTKLGRNIKFTKFLTSALFFFLFIYFIFVSFSPLMFSHTTFSQLYYK